MRTISERARAAGAAALLLLAGAALGIVADRTLLTPPSAEATALTVESLAERLELSRSETGRLRALLDSLHTDVMAAAGEGPEALRAATEVAHRRLEASLDPELRSAFRAWLREHRQHMMRRMHREMLGR